MKTKDINLGMNFSINYILGDCIDRGGNGIVYKVNRKIDNSTYALKCLIRFKDKKVYEKRKLRFKDEIVTLEKLSGLRNPYVMPLIDHNINAREPYWYVMPLGKTISEFFSSENTNFNAKITYFINIAKGIKSLHDLCYYHRDIKPNNILIVNGNIKLADFGLVWHPSFEPRTYMNEKVGPVETIAPEMRGGNPEFKHSSKADIYSFVKTMWMLILDKKTAFVDQYSYVTNDFLSCKMEILMQDDVKTVARLNDLIMKGTEYLPFNRPSIDEVICELESIILDNNLTQDEIKLINHQEAIRQNLFMIGSDTEIIFNFIRIKDFLIGLFKVNKLKIGVELYDGSFDTKFIAEKIHVAEVENGIFLESSKNKKYLLVLDMLEIDKLNGKISLGVKEIKIEEIPTSNIYEYRDYYSVSLMERILGDIEGRNEKSMVEVMSKSEKFVLQI